MRVTVHRAGVHLLGLGLLLLLAGCPASSSRAPSKGPPARGGGEAVPFEVLDQTRSSGFKADAPTALAVEDGTAWAQLWASHRNDEAAPALPDVDFSTHAVVAVFAGPGGGGLTVSRIVRRGEELTVSAERANIRGCSRPAVIENSAELVRIPKPGGRVTLQLETVGKGCD